MTLGAEAPGGRGHDAGVVDEDVEARLGCGEARYGGADGGEVGEVEREEVEVAGAGGWGGGLDGRDGGGSFGGGAASDVDIGVMGVQDLAEFEAYAGVAACYEEDLGWGWVSEVDGGGRVVGRECEWVSLAYSACLVGAVLLGQWRSGNEEVLTEYVAMMVECS